MKRSAKSVVPLLLGVGVLSAFGFANKAMLGQPVSRIQAEIEVGLPVPAQLLVTAGDRYLAANFGTLRVLVADTQKMTSGEFALQGTIQSDVAWLNPAHEDNFYIAAAILPWSGQLDAAQNVLHRASDARPFDWQPPFYVAFNHYFFLKDPAEGAKWLKRAAERSRYEDEKLDLQQIAALWAAKAPDLHMAIRLHRELIQATKHREFAAFLEKRIVRLENLLAIDVAQSRFSSESGKIATRIDELVAGDFLKVVPIDPFGMPYVLGNDGKASVGKMVPVERKGY